MRASTTTSRSPSTPTSSSRYWWASSGSLPGPDREGALHELAGPGSPRRLPPARRRARVPRVPLFPAHLHRRGLGGPDPRPAPAPPHPEAGRLQLGRGGPARAGLHGGAAAPPDLLWRHGDPAGHGRFRVAAASP